MEWYGEKMLPRGLPELIHQVTPHWIGRNLKVIAYNRLPDSFGKGCFGKVHRDRRWWIIELFPTNFLFYCTGPGVASFNYWLQFLKTILHEIGHIVTSDIWVGQRNRYKEDFSFTMYVEALADRWMERTRDTIASRDPRLGQPRGWIGGLPGVYLIRNTKNSINSRIDECCTVVVRRIQDIRAYKCGGQLTSTSVVFYFVDNYLPERIRGVPRFMRRLNKYVKKTAPQIGITRSYTDTAGRNHLFFNHGEAMAIMENLRKYVLENDLIDDVVRESLHNEDALQDTRNS